MDGLLASPIDPLQLSLRFATALGLGVLLGLERERAKKEAEFAGVRTLGMLALAGGIAAFVDVDLGRPWFALAIFVAMAALVTVSYAITAERGQLGMTTEVTALLAFLLGYLCVAGHGLAAATLAVASGSLLALKEWLHGLAKRIEPADVEATLKFAIVSVIVLPLVPDRSFGPPPLDVINPFKIWLMVVLISGLNFASYLLVKIVGTEHGIGLTGLLGGLVSSTAVTLGFAQRSRETPKQAATLALGILIAWTVMFARVVVLVAAVDRALVPRIGLAMLAFAIPSLLVCWFLWRRGKGAAAGSVNAGKNYLGTAGLYLAAGLAGLTDVDAIALSMSQLAAADPASADPAARAIVIAVAANTLFKAGLVAFLGAPGLRNVIFAAAARLLAIGGAAAWLA
jgi:uncharacterized membrane protein (DUF4010 family)